MWPFSSSHYKGMVKLGIMLKRSCLIALGKCMVIGIGSIIYTYKLYFTLTRPKWILTLIKMFTIHIVLHGFSKFNETPCFTNPHIMFYMVLKYFNGMEEDTIRANLIIFRMIQSEFNGFMYKPYFSYNQLARYVNASTYSNIHYKKKNHIQT